MTDTKPGNLVICIDLQNAVEITTGAGEKIRIYFHGIAGRRAKLRLVAAKDVKFKWGREVPPEGT